MKYMAVECSSCGMLQVKEVRKTSSTTKTWCCAICNKKQSVRKVYTTADSAKDVRKFVQKFNLTMGLAAEAESMTRFEGAADTLEGSSVNYCDQEHQEWAEEEEVGYGRQIDSFKCNQQLMFEEEPVCSGDTSQQSFNDDKIVTSLPPSRMGKSHSSCESSSPPLPRSTMHGLHSSRDETKAGNLIPTGRKDHSDMDMDNSLRLKRVRDSVFDDNTPLYPSLNPSAWPEVSSSVLRASQTDCSPKKVKACHAYLSGAQISKWSKYLT